MLSTRALLHVLIHACARQWAKSADGMAVSAVLKGVNFEKLLDEYRKKLPLPPAVSKPVLMHMSVDIGR